MRGVPGRGVPPGDSRGSGSAPSGPHEFLATGDPEPFARLGRRFLGPEIGAVSALSGASPVAR